MLGRIRSPEPPDLGSGDHLSGAGSAFLGMRERPLKPDIRCWKGIWLTQNTHGNGLCRPFTDTADRAEFGNCVL
jgi:hypothetical protein